MRDDDEPRVRRAVVKLAGNLVANPRDDNIGSVHDNAAAVVAIPRLGLVRNRDEHAALYRQRRVIYRKRLDGGDLGIVPDERSITVYLAFLRNHDHLLLVVAIVLVRSKAYIALHLAVNNLHKTTRRKPHAEIRLPFLQRLDTLH